MRAVVNLHVNGFYLQHGLGLGIRAISCYWAARQPWLSTTVPNAFSGLEDAAKSLNFQIEWMYYFRRRTVAATPNSFGYTAIEELQELLG